MQNKITIQYCDFNYCVYASQNPTRYELKKINYPFLSEEFRKNNNLSTNNNKFFSYGYWNTGDNLNSETNDELNSKYFVNIFINYFTIRKIFPDYKIRLYIYEDNLNVLFKNMEYVYKNLDKNIFSYFEIISCKMNE